MNIIYETKVFSDWLDKLLDMKAKARIVARIISAKAGNFGNSKSLGDGILEIRLDVGPGYRIYYGQKYLNVFLLLIGGDKSSQNKDILKAKKMWQILKDEK